MKFKIEPKDLFIFALYCILLLYLCAVAVLNFAYLINEGTFYGLLPFRAFIFPYLPVTLIAFFAVLVIIFSSVSSYIFKKDKDSSIFNWGLIVKEKSSDGYSKWAKEKDIKGQSGVEVVDPTTNSVEAAGLPLINNGKEIWVDNGEYHNLVLGSTGSGKTQTIVKPMVNLLAKKGESMIITDPKGEIYKYSANYLKKQGYNVIVLNFREPQKGNAWNPLTLPYQYYKNGNNDKAIELLNDVAANILHEPDSKDPFWGISAGDYFSGLALGLMMDAKEEEINMNSINFMSTIGEERYAAGSNYIKEYFHLKGEQSTPYIFASNTITAPNETKGSILSTFRQKIRNFSTGEALSEMLSYSDFDMRDLGRGKTAVFMIIHDEKKTYHSLMTIFIKQCYETLIDVAQENGGKLPFRTNFILDEFANMPPLKDVDAMVSAARSRDIRFTFIIQNFAQLNDVYGTETAEIIKGNCGNIVYLISTEMKALEEISKMCGEVKVDDEKDKSATRPLITISDLQKMKLFEVIIIRLRTSPFRTQLEPDFKINWGIERIEEPYPQRQMREVKLFDLKKYITEQRNKNMANNPNQNMMGNSPFQMNQGFNPFINNQNANQPTGITPNMGMQKNPMMNSSMGMNNSFNQNPNLFEPSNNNGNMKNTMFGGLDIDAMMKDIDEKLRQLDLEEEKAKQKEKEELAKKEADLEIKLPDIKFEEPEIKSDEVLNIEPQQKVETLEPKKVLDNTFIDEPKLVTPSVTTNESDIVLPKINVDKESIIVNENVITDDEFFDDFFSED